VPASRTPGSLGCTASDQTWLPLYMPVLLGIREIVSPRSLLDHTDKPFVAT
jgi:hypothetical protein